MIHNVYDSHQGDNGIIVVIHGGKTMLKADLVVIIYPPTWITTLCHPDSVCELICHIKSYADEQMTIIFVWST